MTPAIAWNMGALAAGILLIPLLDQTLKTLVRRWLGSRTIALSPLGCVRLVQGRVWLACPTGRPHLGAIWALWLSAGAALSIMSVQFPACGSFAGLLLGGSLSHALETSLRGGVDDYVCLRFWPAFNLADVAISIGAGGILVHLMLIIRDVTA